VTKYVVTDSNHVLLNRAIHSKKLAETQSKKVASIRIVHTETIIAFPNKHQRGSLFKKHFIVIPQINPTNNKQAATMLNSPFSTPYDDCSRYVHSQQSYRQMMLQQAHDEELRRRRAGEVEYRRQLSEALQRRAFEEELARRRKTKEEKALAEKRRQSMASRRHHSEPSYQVIRGLDGLFYRVPIEMAPEVSTVQQEPSAMKEEKEAPHWIVRGRDGRFYRVTSPAVTDDKSPPEDIIPTASVPEVDPEVVASALERPLKMKENTDPAPKPKCTKSKKPRRHRVTVIVEDASDSEYEDEALNSVWCNRRPSPGEWMEPVESM
jgi:hypothetical protein